MKKYIILQILLFYVCICFAQDIILNKIVEYPTCGEYFDKDQLDVKDQYLFAVSTYGLEIYGIESNTPAQLISRIPLHGDARAIEVKDNYAYVQSVSYNGEGYTILYKIDIGNVNVPTVVKSIYNYEESGYAQIDTYNDFIIIKNRNTNDTYYYSIYSIPDLEFIQNYYCSGVFMKLNDSLAFKACGGENFMLYDMTDPQNITETNQVNFSAGDISTNHIQAMNDTILACLGYDGVSFWNYSDISNIQYLSTIYSYTDEYFGRNLYNNENYVFVLYSPISDYPGLKSIDISDIYNPNITDEIIFTEISWFNSWLDITGIGNSVFTGEGNFMNQVICNDGYFGDHYIINEHYGQYGGDVYDDYLYVNFIDGLMVYDVSSLPDVTPTDTLLDGYMFLSMQRVDNFLFIFEYTDHKILVLDITDPLSPIVRNEVPVSVSGSILLTDSPYTIYYIRRDNNKLYKYSISQPNAYTMNFQYNLYDSGKGFIYNDHLYFVVENSKGSDLRIYGGLDENNPELIETIVDIGGGVDWFRMKNYDNIFYLSNWDEWEGYTMFYEIGEPTEITYRFSTPHCCNGEFFIDGDYLFASGYFSYNYIFNHTTSTGLVEPMASYQDYGSNLCCKEYESNGQKYLYHFQSTAFSIYEIEGYGTDPEPEASDQLFSSYPNPFSAMTTISFSEKLNLHGFSQLKIYNIRGQLVRELKIQNLKLKINEAVWDGHDENGNEVSSGVYFYKIDNNDENIGKVVKLR